MPQPAFQVDVLQIEPGTGTTQTVGLNALTGDLQFVSPLIAAGIDLLSLAGLRNMQGVYLVGKAGSGAPYTVIQDALDAINGATSSATNPALILVGPGVYTELLTIEKSGIWLVGLGGVTITNGAAVDHTITVDNGAGTPPQQVVFQNLKVLNNAPNYACIRLAGGASSNIGLVTGAQGGIWVRDCHLANTVGGGYTVWAEAINNLYIHGGTQAFSDPSAVLRVDQVAVAEIKGVSSLSIVRLDYDTSSAVPATAGSSYTVTDCPSIAQVVSTLLGDGTLNILRCSTGTLTLDGDQSASIQHSAVGNMTVGTTLAVTLLATSRGTAAGTGTLAEPFWATTATFIASSSETVTFDVDGPDANYSVAVELPSAPAGTAFTIIENKTASGFDIAFRNTAGVLQAQTMVVTVTVQRSA